MVQDDVSMHDKYRSWLRMSHKASTADRAATAARLRCPYLPEQPERCTLLGEPPADWSKAAASCVSPDSGLILKRQLPFQSQLRSPVESRSHTHSEGPKDILFACNGGGHGGTARMVPFSIDNADSGGMERPGTRVKRSIQHLRHKARHFIHLTTLG